MTHNVSQRPRDVLSCGWRILLVWDKQGGQVRATLLDDLELRDARYEFDLIDDHGGRAQRPIRQDKKIVSPAIDALESWQTPATCAWLIRESADIAEIISDEWHGKGV
jgi:hypothetical protein